jgi:hypothetical protein
MLMFGPKNAPAKQTQFLYLYGRGSGKISTFEDLKSCRPRRGVVLTMTQFDGIPMADMFKVLQYWGFEDHGSSDSPAVLMSIGVHIHFIKSTLLKGQIVSGVRDELAVLSKKYLTWSRSRIEEFILAEDNRTSVVTQVNSNPGPSVSVDAAVPPGTVAEQPKRVPRRLLNESVQHADEPLKHEAHDSSIGSHNAYLLSGIYGYVILGTLSRNQTLTTNLLYVMLFMGSIVTSNDYLQNFQLISSPVNVFDAPYFMAAYGTGEEESACPFAGVVVYDRIIGKFLVSWTLEEIESCLDPQYVGYSSSLQGSNFEFEIDVTSLVTAVAIGGGIIDAAYTQVIRHLRRLDFRGALYSVDLRINVNVAQMDLLLCVTLIEGADTTSSFPVESIYCFLALSQDGNY